MSAATTPARHLLAILEDEQALETRPLDDVLADLSAHGVDPAGPIRLARRLAGQSAGPAAALLGAVIEDEAAEAEIAALETADIDDVRGRLEAGTVAAVAAEARRRAGGRSNVVGLRRRRGAAWAWAGSLVGMAACALIVVAVWWPSSDLRPPEPSIMAVEVAPEPAPSLAEATAPRSSTALGRLRPDADSQSTIAEREASDSPQPQPVEPEAAPAMLAAEESADRAPAPETPAAGAVSAGAAVIAREPSAAPMADIAELPGEADGPEPRVRNEIAAAPTPPPIPDERRAASEESAAAQTVGGPPAESGAVSTEDWIARLQRPATGQEGAMRGLNVEIVPSGPEMRSRGAGYLVTDGVLYPQAFGLSLGDDWSDGAFPVLAEFDIEGVRAPMVGLVADPAPIGSEVGDPRAFGSFVPMPISPGTISGLAPAEESAWQARQEALVPLAGAMMIMLREARSAGADPWTGGVGDRLAEAQQLAGGRPILGLLTISLPDGDVDAALLRNDPDAPVVMDGPTQALVRFWFRTNPEDFALIVLPKE